MIDYDAPLFLFQNYKSSSMGTSNSEGLNADQQVTVRLNDQGFTTQVISGKHELTADEPVHVGGNDLGPTPYDLLLASLGTCTAMTLRMYINRKKWKVDGIDVHLSHSRVHADDCDHCEEKTALIDRIEKRIVIRGDLDKKQRKRLADIADRCPVHKTLLATPKIVSEMEYESSPA